MAEKEKEIKKKAQDTEDISFEAGLSRLDEIIRILESDKAPLDTLMKL